MQSSFKLCLAAAILSTQIQAIGIAEGDGTDEWVPTKCQKMAMKKYDMHVKKCKRSLDEDLLGECQMECETIENLDELHMCREECVDEQIGFCMKIGEDHKEALWRQCDLKEEIAW